MNVDTLHSGLSPEIAYFYTADDGETSTRRKKRDWYIKGNEYVCCQHLPTHMFLTLHFLSYPGQPSYDARYILR